MHWLADAACRDKPTAWFITFDKADNNRAKAVCLNCPVKRECLIDGFDTPFIRAGMSKYDRLLKIWHRIDSVEESNFDD